MAALASSTRWRGVADGFSASGYFRLAERNGVFWLVDPDGGRFLSKGVNTVRLDQDRVQNSDRIPYAEACRREYDDQHSWRAAVARRLARWGFNTLGAWSDEAVASAGAVPLATTPLLDLGMSYTWRNGGQTPEPTQEFPDVFDPAFERHVRGRSRDLCGRRQQAQNILGWFVDNELCWGPDWRGGDELLTLFLNLGAHAPGRRAALNWLQVRHRDFNACNSVWRSSARSWDEFENLPRLAQPYRRKPIYQRTAADEDAANRANPNRAVFAADCEAFSALVVERYFALTTTAVKAADPNHLLLGCRFAYVPSHEMIELAGRYNDVISFNCYDRDATAVIEAYAAAGRPCLIGEFSFRGVDSGLPNSNGAGPLVATQAERAAGFRHYVTAALHARNLVGYHWFEHADQPRAGRFDGENSNFGTVTIDDLVYEQLTQAMTSLNGEAEHLHAAADSATR